MARTITMIPKFWNIGTVASVRNRGLPAVTRSRASGVLAIGPRGTSHHTCRSGRSRVSRDRSGSVGAAISGDLPTDYISSADVDPPQHPRKAVHTIAIRWLKVVDAWKAGRDYQGFRIGGPLSHEELAPMLESRAKLLLEWVDDESFWTD